MFLSKHFLGAKVDELEDIQRNLGFVLSTKRGCGHFIDRFGLSEMTFRTPEEAITQLTAELEENIRRFEPRVTLVKVDEEYDDDGKRVRLVAILRRRDARDGMRLVFDLGNKSFSFELARS
jgi:phage baseplate assembly protein W